MTRVWRLVKSRFSATAFDGEGARRQAGRWNSEGTPIVYTASTVSLAALELLVHADVEDMPTGYVAIPADIPESVRIETIDISTLPMHWRGSAPYPRRCQTLGDAWVVSKRTAVLAVPSVVVPMERNYLLNPAHPDFRKLVIGKPDIFRFDGRLLPGKR
ncbi:MAG: RES family NAD+ phosphorylase [Deltaproteobacteria bacterium]|nr:RES family NAD+ phosphorylase [Deltaproteobacteria bacterium]